MANMLPPVKGAAFTFYISLVSQADTDIFKTTVTLAAGDVTYFGDGVAKGNLGTLPVEIGTTGVLTVVMASGEMNYDSVVVRFRDAADSEWQDVLVTIYTSAQTFDGMPDAIHDEVVDSTYTLRQLVRGFASVLLGKSANSGADYRDLADSKYRVDSTLDDDGNRTAISLDLT